MKHIKRLLIAAAIFTLLGTASCGASADVPQQSGANTEAPQQTALSSETESTQQTADEAESTQQEAPAFDPESLPAITLTSENLHDGVWDAVISNTNKGENRSPQLAWEPVAGAACYAVYMVDTGASYWLHWKSLNVTETTLAEGAASEKEYIGPYPPSGTHHYEIRVYALRESVKEEKSRFDSGNFGFDDMMTALDKSSSGAGNVLAYGTLTGSYTRS